MKLRYPIASGFYTREIDMSKVTIKDEHSETPLDLYIHGLNYSIKCLIERVEAIEEVVNRNREKLNDGG